MSLLVVLAFACGPPRGSDDGGAGEPGPSPGDLPAGGPRPTTSVVSSGTGTRLSELSESEIREKLRQAADLVFGFWDYYYEQAFGEPWDPPGLFGEYSRTRPAVCGEEALPVGNAWYCGPDDFIAWDPDLFVAIDEMGGGDTAIFMVLAHEMGHAIQARLGIANPQATVRQELQADCIAGATLGRAVADGQLVLEQGDEEEILETIFGIADQANVPWGDPTKHGSALQRGGQFQTGWEGGLAECF